MSRGDRARQIADSMFDRDVAPNAWRAAEAGALKALSSVGFWQWISFAQSCAIFGLIIAGSFL